MKKVLLLLTTFVITLFINTPVKAASLDHSLIYDIEKFEVTKETITFEGWAFINNFHNYGGSSTNISILANDTVAGKIEYNSTKNSSLYEANCIRYTGLNQPCIESHDASTCKIGVLSSSCKFDNVGFKVTFSISELIEKLGKDKTITFKLKVTTQGVTKSTNVAVPSTVSNVQNGDVIEGDNTTIEISGISNTATIRVEDGRVLASDGSFLWGSNFIKS